LDPGSGKEKNPILDKQTSRTATLGTVPYFIPSDKLDEHQLPFVLPRLKHAWMYKDERMYLENKAAEMELPSIEEQADPPPKPLQVDLKSFNPCQNSRAFL
jgi:hypothetical protein